MGCFPGLCEDVPELPTRDEYGQPPGNIQPTEGAVKVRTATPNYWALDADLTNRSQCVLALGDSQFGVVVLPTVLYLAKVLAKLALGLDRRPDLIAHIRRTEGETNKGESVEKVTLVEKSANVVREAFIKCLTDRTGTPGPAGKPEGKRVGIYLMANLCLKLLFQVRIPSPVKHRNQN